MSVKKLEAWKRRALLVTTLAALSAACVCLAALFHGPSCNPHPPAVAPAGVSKPFGKRVAPVGLNCSVKGLITDPSGTRRADLILSVTPFRDVTGASVEFTLPHGWRTTGERAYASEEFGTGTEKTYVLSVEAGPGCQGFPVVRVCTPAGTREGLFDMGFLEAAEEGRPDLDWAGNKVRVFPAAGGR